MLRCPSTFGTGARFRLQDRALGAWCIDRLSKILDYLIDNLCHYILSEVMRGGQQESGMDGSILFQNGNLVEPFLASRQTRGPGTDHGPRLSVNNLLGYCQIRAATYMIPCEVGKTGAELIRNTPVRLVQDAVHTRCPRSRNSPARAKSRFSIKASGQGPSSMYCVGTRGNCCRRNSGSVLAGGAHTGARTARVASVCRRIGQQRSIHDQ